MLNMIKTDGRSEYALLEKLAARRSETDPKITETVAEIIDAVKARGDQAVREYTEKFDGMISPYSGLSRDAIMRMSGSCSPEVSLALQHAAENIREFHEHQKRSSITVARKDGGIVGQRVRALDKVGIYIPGGTAAYPSSVLMCAIPAKVAGVKEIVMVTPPAKDNQINTHNFINAPVLQAAALAGVDRMFYCGGVQAIAALAYGTETVPKVDKIVGPGNIYVTTAKRLLYGVVDIDMIAGPSEILIVADETADPEYLAADLLAQAEHDPMASAILVTTDETVARKTVEAVEHQLPKLSRQGIIRRSLTDYGAAIVCRDMDEAIMLANRIAPEHVEVAAADPVSYLGKLDNAGSIFLGQYSPEPLGDYYAGPNHVLPTGGTARFFSPLSVDSFVKKSGFIYYPREALKQAKVDIVALAEAEGLDAHARSVQVRFPEKGD